MSEEFKLVQQAFSIVANVSDASTDPELKGHLSKAELALGKALTHLEAKEKKGE